MRFEFLPLALLVAGAACNPIAADAADTATTPASTTTTARPPPTGRPRPPCVLTEGENPIIIDPFTRPTCVCDCFKQACRSLNVGGSYEDYVGCINTFFGPNPVDFGTEMIAAYGACVGSRRCIG